MYKNEENFMSNVIIKATNDQLSQMKAYYRSYLLNKQIPYTIFAAKKDGTTITAYTSGKRPFLLVWSVYPVPVPSAELPFLRLPLGTSLFLMCKQ